MDWLKKHKIRISLAVIIACAIFYALGLNGFLPLNEDTAIYISMAKNISGIFRPGASPAYDVFSSKYPFVYPAMLSPLVYLWPGNYSAMKLFTVLLAFVLLIFLFAARKKLFREDLAAPVLFLTALSPQIALYSRSILSEIPFTLFSLLAVYFLILYEEKLRLIHGYLFLAFLAALLAFYTRLIGVSLLISIPLFLLLKKELKKAVIFSAGCAVFSLPWICYNFIAGRSAYVNEFSVRTAGLIGLGSRWVYNLAATVGKELPDLFFYPFLAGIDPYELVFIYKFIFGLLLAVFILAGFCLKIKNKGIGLAEIYVFVYFSVFYLFWTHHGARYLVPILAFLIYYLLLAIKSLPRSKNLFYPLIVLFILLNITGNIKETVREKNAPFTPAEDSFIRSANWLKNNVPADSIVVSRRPAWLSLYANGLRGIGFLITGNVSEQYDYVLNNKTDYIIIDQNKIYRDDARDYLLPLVERYKNMFEKVYASAGPVKTLIYKVKK